MIKQPEKQSIVCDWAEMHFRIKDSSLFRSETQATLSRLREESLNTQVARMGGVAFPKINASGKDRFQHGQFVFKRISMGGKFYSDRYHVWHHGKVFAELLANSRDKKAIPLDDVSIKVQNNKLYETGWTETLQQLSKDIEGKFHNITALDIAIDGGNWICLHKKWLDKSILKAGKAAVNGWYQNDTTTTGFYIGMSGAKKRMKVYNKTKELTKSNKTYISRFWKLNGLDQSQDIERLELSMFADECKKYPALDWTRLSDSTHLASIMKSGMNKFCDFREPTDLENISRCKPIEIVDWNKFNTVHLSKDSTKMSTEIFSAKVTIKKLYQVYLMSKQQVYYDVAYEVAMNSDLCEWMNSLTDKWTDDFASMQGYSRDGVISNSWVTHFKSYNPNEQIHIFDENEN